MAPVSAPKMAKNTQPIMLATRSGTMVSRQKGGDKEARAHQSEHVCQGDVVQKDFGSRRLKMAFQVTSLGSRPI